MVRDRPPPKSRDSYSPRERGLYGAIATLVNTETGATVVRAWTGRTTPDATREAAELCNTLGPEWKVRALSHPLSILRDLDNAGGERGGHRTEAALLARIGRPDLNELEPLWLGLRTEAAAKRARKAW